MFYAKIGIKFINTDFKFKILQFKRILISYTLIWGIKHNKQVKRNSLSHHLSLCLLSFKNKGLHLCETLIHLL